jgi:hypothetical protein
MVQLRRAGRLAGLVDVQGALGAGGVIIGLEARHLAVA